MEQWLGVARFLGVSASGSCIQRGFKGVLVLDNREPGAPIEDTKLWLSQQRSPNSSLIMAYGFHVYVFRKSQLQSPSPQLCSTHPTSPLLLPAFRNLGAQVAS